MAKKIKDENGNTYVQKKPFYKRWWFIAIVVIFVLGILGEAFGDDSDDTSSHNTKTEQKSSKDSSSSSTAKTSSTSNANSNNVKNSSSSSSDVTSSSVNSSESSSSSAQTKNVEQANAAISERLSQSQGWANGTLDPNGDPTNAGTPNPAYNWAKIITSIKYAENELTIYVNKDYIGLPKTQFASYMTRAENASLNALQEAGIINDADVQKGLYTRVFDGDTKLAQSKVTDLHQFKINQ